MTNLTQNYFTQHGKLAAVKSALLASLAYTTWVYPVQGDCPTNELVTKSNLIAKTSAPTNWFEVTPYFNLAMDSNGWMFVPQILSNLVWIVETAPVGALTNYSNGTFGSSGVGDTYSNAYLDAVNNWYTTSTQALITSYATTFYFETNRATLKRSTADLYVSSVMNSEHVQRDSIIDIYNYFTLATPGGTYDAQGDSVPSSPGYQLLGIWTNQNLATKSPVYSLSLVGSASAPANYSDDTTLGWRINMGAASPKPFRTIHKYNDPVLTNGFKWFR